MFYSWPSIELLHNVVKTYETYPHVAPGPVRYRAKIKLHGTNASVQIRNDRVIAQGRNTIITSAEDNMGFAEWVEKSDYWYAITIRGGPDFTVYGEWCGPEIMKGTAINKIPNRIFAVFGIILHDDEDEMKRTLITDPITMESWLPYRPSDILILPWMGEEFTIEYSDRDNLKATASYLNEEIDVLEKSDPWVKETFGVEGTAEGMVLYPYWNNGICTRKQFSDLAFKVKGQKHKVLKMRQNVQIDPEVAATIDEFVEMFVTPARLDQGLEQIGGKADMRMIGPFLAWFCSDVQKESIDELKASGLEWRQVVKSVQLAARTWYLEQAKKI